MNCYQCTDEQQELIIDLRNTIEERRFDLCNEIYKGLETDWEALTSEECIIANLIDNKYEFTETGERF